jgi:protein TonB|tara:strand:+ start:275 stop:946 length:672 start_codon:yes stop_codon:yes gene_type:complete
MELKKSENANVDKLRLPFVAIGFLFIGSLVLASFSYTAGVERNDGNNGEQKVSAVKFEQEVKKDDETPPPPTPPQVDAPPPPQEEIIEKKNEEKEPVVVVAPPPPPVPKGPETKVEVKEEIIEFPDVEAQFPGGMAELQKYIASNINYPQTSIEMNEQGKVYLSFVVEPDGTISNIVVERGVSSDLDREAKRVVRGMPKWTPGEAGGKKARTRCRLPINFTLN